MGEFTFFITNRHILELIHIQTPLFLSVENPYKRLCTDFVIFFVFITTIKEQARWLRTALLHSA